MLESLGDTARGGNRKRAENAGTVAGMVRAGRSRCAAAGNEPASSRVATTGPPRQGFRVALAGLPLMVFEPYAIAWAKLTGQCSDLVQVAEQAGHCMLGYEAKLAVAWGAQRPGRGNNGGGSMQRLSRPIV